MTNRVKAQVITLLEGRVRVRLDTLSGGCGRCDEPGGCRSARLTHAFGPVRDVFELPDPTGLATHSGQTLWLELPEGGALHAALKAYTLPILMALGAAFTAHLLFSGHDLATVAGALAGLVLGLRWGRGWAEKNPAFHIRLASDTDPLPSPPLSCRKHP